MKYLRERKQITKNLSNKTQNQFFFFNFNNTKCNWKDRRESKIDERTLDHEKESEEIWVREYLGDIQQHERVGGGGKYENLDRLVIE